MNKKSFVSYVVGFLLFFGVQSLAKADSKGMGSFWIGGLGGLESADGTSFNLFGGHLGFRLGAKARIGAHYLTSQKKTASLGIATAEVTHSLYGVESWWGLDSLSIFNLGLKAGSSVADGKATVLSVQVSTHTSDIYVGPAFAIDLPLSSFLSVGVDASYLYVAASDSYSIVAGLASLKLWF